MEEFQGFAKIPRLFRDIVITEKIDGTNAQVDISTLDGTEFDDWEQWEQAHGAPLLYTYSGEERVALSAGSKKQYITPQKDNFGFAKWVQANGLELIKLGVGRHYGEWWGQGIQRNYGLKEKRFSLFNVAKWGDAAVRPACCGVVPTLATGLFNTEFIQKTIYYLRVNGSAAAPGYMKPEGIVVFHTAGNLLFKATLENDEKWKGATE